MSPRSPRGFYTTWWRDLTYDYTNANDGVSGANTRFERLFTPTMFVPSSAEYVTLIPIT